MRVFVWEEAETIEIFEVDTMDQLVNLVWRLITYLETLEEDDSLAAHLRNAIGTWEHAGPLEAVILATFQRTSGTRSGMFINTESA